MKQILYLNQNSLILLTSKGGQKVEYPESVLKFQEVINDSSFEELTSKLIQGSKIKNADAVIILAKELLYEKETTEESYQSFLNQVPFSKEHLGKLKLSGKNSFQVIAANKDLYLKLKLAVEKNNWKIEAVLPGSVFGADFNGISKTLGKIDSKKYNFLSEISSDEPDEAAEVKKGILNNYKISIPLIIILFAVPIYLLISGNISLNFWQKRNAIIQKKAPVLEASTSAAPITTPIPATESGLLKKDMKVLVLNGSGIAGQAGKIKKELEDMGFTDIDTGNAPESVEKKSLIVFGSWVSDEIKKEVTDKLASSLGDISRDATQSGKIDILITTR